MPVQAQNPKDAAPFGPIGEVEVDQLMKFGKARGFDLQPEMQRIYKKDEEALARLFGLSLKFKTFDRKARTYGQIMYSCWLRFGELYGVDLYLKVLDRQPDEVQQRVQRLPVLSAACACPRRNGRKTWKRCAGCIRGFSRPISNLGGTIRSSKEPIRFARERERNALASAV